MNSVSRGFPSAFLTTDVQAVSSGIKTMTYLNQDKLVEIIVCIQECYLFADVSDKIYPKAFSLFDTRRGTNATSGIMLQNVGMLTDKNESHR